MTAPAWPSSLNTKFMAISGYQEDALVDPTVRTSMDIGPPKVRSKYTSIPTKFDGVITMLTSDDVNSLISFWQNDCVEGSLNFTWTHPRTGSATTFMWLKFPAVSNMGGTGVLYQANLSLLKIGIPVVVNIPTGTGDFSDFYYFV